MRLMKFDIVMESPEISRREMIVTHIVMGSRIVTERMLNIQIFLVFTVDGACSSITDVAIHGPVRTQRKMQALYHLSMITFATLGLH